MKTFGKIIICIIVILLAIGSAYLMHNVEEKETNNNTLTNTNSSTNTQNTANSTEQNKNETDENTDYIGLEENVENLKETEEPEEKNEQEDEEEQENELTGKDKAIDIVEKQYAVSGQTVRFDHMEGTNYVIKINDGTAVTWYLVDGTTWEAEEY